MWKTRRQKEGNGEVIRAPKRCDKASSAVLVGVLVLVVSLARNHSSVGI